MALTSEAPSILGGNLEHVAHVWEKRGLFKEINIKFATALDLNKMSGD